MNTNQLPQHVTVAIVGGGPAALTAAIYVKRSGTSCVLLGGEAQGGQLMLTGDVENYPGFASPIEGPMLMNAMIEQVKRVGVEVFGIQVKQLTQNADGMFALSYDHEETIHCETVIAATGSNPRMLGLPNEKTLLGRGLSTCAVCDGFFFADQTVAVVGGGNTAVGEALYLSGIAREVILIHRRDKLRADHVMQQRLSERDNIRVVYHHVVTELHSEQAILGETFNGMTLRNTQNGQESPLEAKALFLGIGHRPNTTWLGDLVPLTEEGHVQPGHQGLPFSTVDGLFAVGDVADTVYRQAITAAGMGCMAAIRANEYVARKSSCINHPSIRYTDPIPV